MSKEQIEVALKTLNALDLHKGKILLHTDVETVGGFDHAARTIWSIAWILTDTKGNELGRKAFLVSEAMPLLAGDTFWSTRKNSMLCKCLGTYQTVTAAQMWAAFAEDLQRVNESGGYWVAFNSRFERGAFKRFPIAFNVPVIDFPPELDLALYAFDVLPFKQYAAYAVEHSFYTEKKNLSSKC